MAAILLDAEERSRGLEESFCIEKSAEKAFPKLQARGFSGPAQCLIDLINWMWLQSRVQRDDTVLDSVASEVLTRAFEFYGLTTATRFKSAHDLFLLSAAIVLGNRSIIERAAQTVDYAGESSHSIFYASCCGLLKARLLGDAAMEEKQLALLGSCKGGPSAYRVASRASYRAFVGRNRKLLVTHSKKACDVFWDALEREHYPEPLDRQGSMSISGLSTNAFWPWPELTLLKVTGEQEKEWAVDSFWLPPELLRRWR